MHTPLMIVGDGPHEPTGLGRIARDIAAQLRDSGLPIDLVQVGGCVPPVWPSWPHYPLDRSDDWGARCTEALWRSLFGRRPGILWLIWDPGRCAAYRDVQIPVQKWAYTAIDSTNVNETIGGPAHEMIRDFDQVLAYGRWASSVVRTIRPSAPYLPHGLTLSTYQAPVTPEEAEWVRETLGAYCPAGASIVGCVATNQPRKDLALYCQTLGRLRAAGHNVYGWLHTDVLVKAWAIPQLVDDSGLQKRITVTLPGLTDRQLALLLGACSVTIAPGLGEGFGYPIVESLAAGVPVVHGDFDGGAELVPKKEWRFPVRAIRYESVYAVKRPVFLPDDVANAILRVWAWRDEVGAETATAYCQGTVAHLDWTQLWPRWRQWVQRGIDG